MVERYVRDVEVAGSNPVTPIILLDTTKLVISGFVVFFVMPGIYKSFQISCDKEIEKLSDGIMRGIFFVQKR